MPSNEDVIFSPRMGGEVKRYHTWATIRTQTVADHTFHVLRIYWHLFGEVPPEVTAYLIHHDICEVRVGDLPHPIKLHNPVLKSIYDELEDETLVQMVGEERAMNILGSVNDLERVRMKACDLLEMAEFASVEVNLGNRYAWPIFDNIAVALAGLALTEHDMLLVVNHYNITARRAQDV